MACDTIRFYSDTGEFGELSNFAPYPVVVDGRRWPTTEHYFQAQKFRSQKDQETIRRAGSPSLAARLGRSRRRKLRRDWESAKVGVMRVALRAKFEQHPELAALLLSTGEATIVEHTPRDGFWGDGGDGSGRNMLGRLLMEIRQELQGRVD